jgi:hypothetical protein
MDRFKDLNWFNRANNTEVFLLGLGGIGSWAAMLLARTGLNVYAMDYDIVDRTNISGQFFFTDQILLPKTKAVQLNNMYFGGKGINAIEEKLTKHTSNINLKRITIVGTDNMQSRKDLFNIWRHTYLQKGNNQKDVLFVDGRLNAESYQIFCIRNEKEADNYKNNFLYDDSEIPDVSCTAKQTSHYAAMIAGEIVRFVTNFLSSLDGYPTYVPFLYEKNGILPDSIKIAKISNETLKLKSNE